MPRTPQEIDSTAEAMKAAGAPDADIRQFVELALKENAAAPAMAAPAIVARPPIQAAAPAGIARFAPSSRPFIDAETGFSLPPGIGPDVVQGPRGQDKAALGTLLDIGAEGGGAAGGQMVGAMTGPLAPATIPAFGAIGAGIGNTIGQIRRINMGEQPKFSLGQLGGAMVGGAIPGASMAEAGSKELAKQATKNVLGAYAAKSTQSIIDTGKMPTGSDAALAVGAGLLGTALSKSMDAGENVVAAAAALKKAQDATRRETLALGRELGYVIPPSVVNPSATNDFINSVGGKAATMQEVVRRNQPMTNAAIREELNLPQNTPLGANKAGELPAMNAAKAGPFAVYDEVKQVSPQAAVALDLFKQQQAEANTLFAQYRDMPVKDPAVKKAAIEAQAKADEYVTLLNNEMTGGGRHELIDQFQQARIKLAKIGLVENAVNKATGDVDAAIIGRAWDANPERLTGNLAKIGRFYNAFPQAVRDAALSPVPGIHQLTPLASAGMAAVADDPRIFLTALGAPKLARDMALSDWYQKAFVNYTYGPSRQDFMAMMGRFAPPAATRLPDFARQFAQRAPAMAPAPPLLQQQENQQER